MHVANTSPQPLSSASLRADSRHRQSTQTDRQAHYAAGMVHRHPNYRSARSGYKGRPPAGVAATPAAVEREVAWDQKRERHARSPGSGSMPRDERRRSQSTGPGRAAEKGREARGLPAYSTPGKRGGRREGAERQSRGEAESEGTDEGATGPPGTRARQLGRVRSRAAAWAKKSGAQQDRMVHHNRSFAAPGAPLENG